MGGTFTLFPTQASTMAGRVDNLYFFMLAVTLFFSVLVAALVVTLAVKYRRRKADDVGANIHGSTALEVIWTAIPLLIAMVMFVWGTSVYFALAKPPAEAMEVYIVGKRWMWKAQHLTGHREINQLHVPVGTPVKLLISSEDVIHSYYIPAFRQKIDAVPGKTTTMWFEATKAGTYQLFCAEYCGTQHSGMIGKVVAMEPREYQQWLSGGAPAGTLTSSGEQRVRHARLRDLPPQRRQGSRAVARRRVRQAAADGQRHDRHRRRKLPARVDPQSAGEDGAGLPAAHADLPGADQRGQPRDAARVHQVAREAGRHRGAGDARGRRPPRARTRTRPCTKSEPTNSIRPPRPPCRPCTT